MHRSVCICYPSCLLPTYFIPYRMVTINDHHVHLQDVHFISTTPGFVSFCYWCYEWSYSSQLSHLHTLSCLTFRYQSEEEWDDHCQAHITTWYLPHELPNLSLPSDPYLGYNMQASTGIVTKPDICPFCL